MTASLLPIVPSAMSFPMLPARSPAAFIQRICGAGPWAWPGASSNQPAAREGRPDANCPAPVDKVGALLVQFPHRARPGHRGTDALQGLRSAEVWL